MSVLRRTQTGVLWRRRLDGGHKKAPLNWRGRLVARGKLGNARERWWKANAKVADLRGHIVVQRYAPTKKRQQARPISNRAKLVFSRERNRRVSISINSCSVRKGVAAENKFPSKQPRYWRRWCVALTVVHPSERLQRKKPHLQGGARCYPIGSQDLGAPLQERNDDWISVGLFAEKGQCARDRYAHSKELPQISLPSAIGVFPEVLLHSSLVQRCCVRLRLC